MTYQDFRSWFPDDEACREYLARLRWPDGFSCRFVTSSSKVSKKVADPDAVMPGPHLVSSLLKRWTAGTLHYRVSYRHMPYYLDEFTFRFNRRTSRASRGVWLNLLSPCPSRDFAVAR